MSRSTSGSASWLAWERRRSRVSGVTDHLANDDAHALRIVRGIMLKGVGLADMQTSVLALTLFMLLAMGLALFRFRRTLD